MSDTPNDALAARASDAVLIISTAPDEATARRVAQGLLEAHAAACVNLVPGARSIYWWQGAIEESAEHVLLIKTTAACVDRAQQLIERMHPYEVPEAIVLPISEGLPRYLEWIQSSILRG